ncbi:disulfide bond formation protein DsbA [Trueperella sp. LYQ141]|uniref:mycothiol-dependent nitroreductase Rv2466c family protein n=1 Tax=Trueperella sp. LYQ141 TaxID=3391058 RepID=UPI0039832730
MSIDDIRDVDFWFDPSCPWTWITSRWLVSVAQCRSLSITWHPYSLLFANEGADISQEYRDHLAHGSVWSRLCAGVYEQYPDLLGQCYTRIGQMIHGSEQPAQVAQVVAAIAEVTGDAQVGQRALDGGYDEVLRQQTQVGRALVGTDVGVPIIGFGDRGIFGPVLSPAPTGQQALRLWDAVVNATMIDGFYELKRTRTVPPIFAVPEGQSLQS